MCLAICKTDLTMLNWRMQIWKRRESSGWLIFREWKTNSETKKRFFNLSTNSHLTPIKFSLLASKKLVVVELQLTWALCCYQRLINISPMSQMPRILRAITFRKPTKTLGLMAMRILCSLTQGCSTFSITEFLRTTPVKTELQKSFTLNEMIPSRTNKLLNILQSPPALLNLEQLLKSQIFTLWLRPVTSLSYRRMP